MRTLVVYNVYVLCWNIYYGVFAIVMVGHYILNLV